MSARHTEVDEEAAWAWWCRNRAAEGLPDKIEDPATITKIVTLAFAGAEGGGGRAEGA
jgi:hypothetical protein